MTKIFSHLFLSSFLLVQVVNACDEIHPGWKAGVARIAITPQKPIWMAGFGWRQHPSEGVLHDLWAKALVLEDSSGKQAVLITTDLEEIPKGMSDRIRDRLKTKFHLSRAQIILNCSHTHSSPVVKGISDFYTQDPEQVLIIDQYTDKLEDQIVTIVGKALQSMQPANLYAQNGVARFQVNRRNNAEFTLLRQTELKGPNDYAVPVIKVVNATGDLIAVAFGYACHNTVLVDYRLSGDYAGFAQLELEKLYPGITALFFQGAGGNQNAYPRRTEALARQYGKTLAVAVERVLNGDMPQLLPTLSVAYSEVELSLTTPPGKEELYKMTKDESEVGQKRWAEIMLDKINRGEKLKTSYPYPVQVWKLGEQTIVALGGEPLIEYAIEFKRIFGQEIFVLGYSNDVMAYIPPAAVLREGGYEAASSQMWASGYFASPWASDIETIIIHEVLRVAKQAGVKLTESKIMAE